MNALNLFLSVLAFLIAGLIVYFQYYHKQKINSDTKLLSLLRFLSLFCILILLINPKFEQNYSEIHKPSLLLGFDNSSSITHLERAEVLSELRQFFLKDKDLNDRFDIEFYKFGAGISTDTLLSFEDAQTDIYNLVDGLNALAPEAGPVAANSAAMTFTKPPSSSTSSRPDYRASLATTANKPQLTRGAAPDPGLSGGRLQTPPTRAQGHWIW